MTHFRRTKWRAPRTHTATVAGKRWRVSPVLLLLGAAFGVFVLWVFITFNPFQTTNPFLREVTIGQNVIGSWSYAGDIDGQLHFWNGYEPIVLPATIERFAADGEFINIIKATPTTLTFEPTYEAEAIGPIILLWMALVCATVLAAFLRGRSRAAHTRMAKVSRRSRGFAKGTRK